MYRLDKAFFYIYIFRQNMNNKSELIPNMLDFKGWHRANTSLGKHKNCHFIMPGGGHSILGLPQDLHILVPEKKTLN